MVLEVQSVDAQFVPSHEEGGRAVRLSLTVANTGSGAAAYTFYPRISAYSVDTTTGELSVSVGQSTAEALSSAPDIELVADDTFGPEAVTLLPGQTIRIQRDLPLESRVLHWGRDGPEESLAWTIETVSRIAVSMHYQAPESTSERDRQQQSGKETTSLTQTFDLEIGNSSE